MLIEMLVLMECKMCVQARWPKSWKAKRRDVTADAKSNKQAAHSESRSLQPDRDKLVRKTRWLFDDKNCDCWHPPFCIFHKRGKCRSGTTVSAKMTVHQSHTSAQSRQKKGFEHDREKQRRRKLCRFSKWRKSMLRETFSAKWRLDPTSQSIGQLTL